MVAFGQLAATVAVPLAAGTLAVEAITDEHLRLIAIISATVGAVVAVVAWIDKRIGGRIKSHAAHDRQRHRAVLSEIRHLRELLSVQFGLPALEPELAEPPDDEEAA